MPLISVIVPVYKVEEYLSRCIDSILAQTYTDFELILVDDGSTDRCGVICDRYAEDDSRVIVIHKENGGVSSARNVGLDIAGGQYIVFVDSDDWVDHKMLEKKMRLMGIYNADIVEVGYCRVKEQTEFTDDAEEEIVVLNGIRAAESLYFTDTFYCNVMVWGKLYKAELFKNIRFPEGRYCEDLAVIYRLFVQSNVIVCCSNIAYFYFQSVESIMRGTFASKVYIDKTIAFEEISEFSNNNGYKKLYDLNQYCLIGFLLISYTLFHSKGLHNEAKQILHKLRNIKFLKNKEMNLKSKIIHSILCVFPKFSKI